MPLLTLQQASRVRIHKLSESWSPWNRSSASGDENPILLVASWGEEDMTRTPAGRTRCGERLYSWRSSGTCASASVFHGICGIS
ncbi:Os03g0305550, partial [Oryza sativa Japonica Group]